MKIIKKLILWIVALTIIYYGYQNIPIQKIGEEVSQRIYLERSNTQFLPDWTSENVLEQINEARETIGLTKIVINEKLSKAARSRLSVIQTDNDYDGSATGITREAVVKNAGYEASLIGDLLLLEVFKTTDPIQAWQDDETLKSSLLHPNFKEAGVAVKNEEGTVSVYVILVTPRKIVPVAKKKVWSGPELWEAVNQRRVELGVNPLRQRDELCTIASIRLNQLLELGKLDGHAGFVPVLERNDLKWISEKYNISEYLAAGYDSPLATVSGWEGALGHRSLLAGGEYVWGCVYAQNGFAVAMAAY